MAEPVAPNIFVQIQHLLDAIVRDEEQSGGLLSRSTLRQSDECRLALNRLRTAHGDLTALRIVEAPIEETPHA